MKSILDIEVSCFAYYNEVKHPKTVNLLAWLNSTKYKEKVDLIRSLDNKTERDLIKPTLPAITPSAILKNRIKEIPLKEKLIKHTGFIQIDIDLAGKNIEISNWNELKNEISNLPQISYFGQSASGRGFWGLIPIPPEPENHKGYFETLFEIFMRKWGIELDDKPISITSLRGYSYDLEGYFNHEAKQFNVLKKLVPVAKIPQKINPTPVTDGKYQWMESWILIKLSQALQGDRHEARLKYSRLAGGLIAGGYLPLSVEESIINSYLSQYGSSDPETVQKKEIKAIRDGIQDGKNTPAMPPPIRCLFVGFTEIEDYSDKAFKIYQGEKWFYIPKSTVFEIMEFGFYVLEYFLTKKRNYDDSPPPAYQSTAWKEFTHDADPIHQIIEKKTLIHDDYQTEFDSIQTEITTTEERNQNLRNGIDGIKKDIQGLEDLFIQASERCKIEWYAPTYISEPSKKNRAGQIKYWCY